MAKIYSAPKEIQLPKFDFRDIKGSKESEKAYVDAIKAWTKANSKDKYAGEEIRIGHADGYACYVVLSAKPVALIHLEIGDCWDAPLAHRLLAKDIVQMVEGEKNLNQLFGRI